MTVVLGAREDDAAERERVLTSPLPVCERCKSPQTDIEIRVGYSRPLHFCSRACLSEWARG